VHSSGGIGSNSLRYQASIRTSLFPVLVGNVNMPIIGTGIGSYVENGDEMLEMVGSTGSNRCQPFLQAFGHSVKGRELDDDSDCESPRTSEGSSEGSFENMKDLVWFPEGDRRGLSPLSVKVLEGVVGQVLVNVRAAGYGEAVCTEFRRHFSRLPSRYVTLSSLLSIEL